MATMVRPSPFLPALMWALPGNNNNSQGCLPRLLLPTEAIEAVDLALHPMALAVLLVALPVEGPVVLLVVLPAGLPQVPIQFPMLGFPWAVDWANL